MESSSPATEAGSPLWVCLTGWSVTYWNMCVWTGRIVTVHKDSQEVSIWVGRAVMEPANISARSCPVLTSCVTSGSSLRFLSLSICGRWVKALVSIYLDGNSGSTNSNLCLPESWFIHGKILTGKVTGQIQGAFTVLSHQGTKSLTSGECDKYCGEAGVYTGGIWKGEKQVGI